MFTVVQQFEKAIADYFGAPYAVATDCCTHALELCLIHTQTELTASPTWTYLSVPMTMHKLGINWQWQDVKWSEYYYLWNTNIVDAATLWKENSYIPGTYMCLSFQFRKHLNLGRGGMILCDSLEDYTQLSKMRYDGRDVTISWYEQDVDTLGYHYYMTPETAQLGLDRLTEAKQKPYEKWTWQDYRYLPDLKVFQDVRTQ